MTPTATHIGIVEDSDEDFAALARQIRRTSPDATVERWSRAEAVVDELVDRETGLPDFFFIDLSLPGVDGCELVRRLRAEESTGALPLFMLSGSARDADVRRCYASGASVYLTKPLRQPALGAVLELTAATPRP
ncbi:MAG: response regulator [Patulibacter sp.]|nr:response regulator [Patulibacter sp.]